MTDRLEDVDISRQPDRKYYTCENEDPTIRTDFEGGYVASRPRHARNPLRRTWTFGYTDISAADKIALEAFWNAQKGGAKIWQWLNFAEWDGAMWAADQADTDPPDPAGYRHLVRFAKDSTLRFEAKGYGRNIRYDVPALKIEEA